MTIALERLLPARLRKTKPIEPDDRMRLFAQVSDGDPCLRGVIDRLQQTLETEFAVAIDPTRSDTEKLRACEGMRISYYNLTFIEQERDKAKEWLRQQNPG